MPTYEYKANLNDGFVRSISSSWATARAGSSLGVNTTSGFQVGSGGLGYNSSDGQYYINQSFFEFDTASQTIDGSIDAAQLTLKGWFYIPGTYEFRVYLHDWGGGTLTNSNFRAAGNYPTEWVSGYVQIDASMFSGVTFDIPQHWINRTGVTRLMVTDARAQTGTAPTTDDRIAMVMADDANAVNTPTLTVISLPGIVPDPSDPNSTFYEDFSDGVVPQGFTTTGPGTVTPGTGTGPVDITTIDGRYGRTDSYMVIGNGAPLSGATMQKTVEVGPGGGMVEFWYTNATSWGDGTGDAVRFMVDTTSVFFVQGNYPNIWTRQEYALTEGVHVLNWEHSVGSSGGISTEPFRVTALTVTNTLPPPVHDPLPEPTDSSVYFDDFDGTPGVPFSVTGYANFGVNDDQPFFPITTLDGRTGDLPLTSVQIGSGQANNADDRLTLNVSCGDGGGTLEFWARRESETTHDHSQFYIDGVQQYDVTGIHAWERFEYSLSPGEHTLEWRYTTDFSTIKGIGSQRITALTLTGFGYESGLGISLGSYDFRVVSAIGENYWSQGAATPGLYTFSPAVAIGERLPVTPFELLIEDVGYTDLTLLWEVLPDSALAFDIERNGIIIARVPAIPTAYSHQYYDSGLTPGETYTYRVRAIY